MNTRIGLLGVWACACMQDCAPAATAGTAADVSSFRHAAAIELPPIVREEIAALPLPPALYADTAEDLRDLRVLDEAGRAVPWRRERVTQSSTAIERRDSPMRTLALAEPPGANRIEILFELQTNAVPPVALEVLTPLRDFERVVRVEGREDAGAPWIVLADQAVLFDARRFMDVAQREVALAPNACRQFRMIIGAVTDETASPLREITRHAGGAESSETERYTLERRPFRIDGVRWWHEREEKTGRKDVLTDYPVTILSVTNDAAARQTRVRLASGRAPLTRITVDTPDVNFSRPFRLMAVEPGRAADDGRELARGTLERLRFRGFEREHLTIGFPERRAGEMELVIEDGDNAPIRITDATAQGVAVRLLFFVRPGAPYRLLSGGDPSAPVPRYDTVALEAAAARGTAFVAATLGEPGPNPEHRAARRRFGGWLGRKGAMTGALVVMVVVLGAILFHSTKKLDAE